MEVKNLLECRDRSELRKWLCENHQKEDECWLIMYVKNKPLHNALPYIDIVEEALCFGWIDSTKKKLHDGRLIQRLSPRRKGSHWTELNIRRCQDLEARGLMRDSGRSVMPKVIYQTEKR